MTKLSETLELIKIIETEGTEKVRFLCELIDSFEEGYKQGLEMHRQQKELDKFKQELEADLAILNKHM